MAGRPEIIIDWKKVDQLLEAGCHTTEIASYFGVSTDSFYNRCLKDKGINFSAYSQEKRRRGDSLLRAKQYEVAMKGDKTMLVWLGKNRLDQKDEMNLTTPLNVNVIDYSKSDSSSQIPTPDVPA